MLVQQGAQLLQQVKDTQIVDLETFERVAAIGQMAKSLAKAISDRFADAVRSADKAHKDVLSIRNDALASFEEVEDASKTKIGEARPDGYEAMGVAYSTLWRFEITDEAKLPREYLEPDMRKIKAAALALKAECRIPGVKVYPITQVKYGLE